MVFDPNATGWSGDGQTINHQGPVTQPSGPGMGRHDYVRRFRPGAGTAVQCIGPSLVDPPGNVVTFSVSFSEPVTGVPPGGLQRRGRGGDSSCP